MLPLVSICQKYNVAYHCYADDIQLYLPLKCNNDSNITTMFECLDGMVGFLQLNESKSEVLIFGPAKLAKQLSVHLGPLATNVNTEARNLGVIFDSRLKFDKQVNAVVRSSYFQLQSIAKLKTLLSFKNMQTVIHAFISSRLDYCNLLYLGLSGNLLSRLQLPDC